MTSRQHVEPTAAPRIRDPGHAARRDLAVAGAAPAACSNATCCRPIWRERRWFPERSARAIRPSVTSAVPFCDIGDNRPWLAFCRSDQRTRRDVALSCCRCRSNGSPRSRALQPRALCRRPPGRPRRHAARRRNRPDLHRPAAAQSARIADGRRTEGVRLEFQADRALLDSRSSRRSRYVARSRPNNPTRRRSSTTTMSSRSIASSSPASIRRSRSAAS